MPLNRPHLYFLKCAASIAILLSAWWFLLREPAIAAIYWTSKVALGFLDSNGNAYLKHGDSGQLDFRAPVWDTQIRSIDFGVPEGDLLLFTLGTPLYLAIVWQAAGTRKKLLWGVLLQWVSGTLLVVLFAEITAYHSLLQMRPHADPVARWALDLAWHLVTLAAPYLIPILSAIGLHPELRSRLFEDPPAETVGHRRKGGAANPGPLSA